MKTNKVPNANGIPDTGFTVQKGGTIGLVGVPQTSKNQPLGIAITNSDNKIDQNLFSAVGLGYSPTLAGPKTVLIGQALEYTITNYSSFREYVLTSAFGTVSRIDDIVYFTPTVAGFVNFVLNGRIIPIEVGAIQVNKPTISGPVPTTDLETSFNFTSSAFSLTNSADTHLSSDWELSLVSNFSTLASSSYNSTVNKTSWTVSGLFLNTVYYARVRHKGSTLPNSEWSGVYTIKTRATVSYAGIRPFLTSPLQGAINVPKTLSSFGAGVPAEAIWSESQIQSEWQLSTDVNFTTLVASGATNAGSFPSSETVWSNYYISNGVSHPNFTLNQNTDYYVRMRMWGVARQQFTNWSLTTSFRTAADVVVAINTPSIISPTITTDLNPAFNIVSSAFVPAVVGETHQSSDWKFLNANPAYFLDLSTTSKITWSVSGLLPGVTYWSMVRHHGSSGSVSNWSLAIPFTIKVPIDLNVAPTINSPINGVVGVSLNVLVSASNFSELGRDDLWLNTQFKISTDINLSNSVTFSYQTAPLNVFVSASTMHPNVAWLLDYETDYYVSVRYESSVYGWTPWSQTTSFTTGILLQTVNKPTIVFPAANAYDRPLGFNATCNNFSWAGGGSLTWQSSDWQLYKLNNSAQWELLSENNTTSSATTFFLSGLAYNTGYLIKTRHRSTTGLVSEWSDGVNFTTISLPAASVEYIGNSVSYHGFLVDLNVTVLFHNLGAAYVSSITPTYNGIEYTGFVPPIINNSFTWNFTDIVNADAHSAQGYNVFSINAVLSNGAYINQDAISF